MGLPADMAGRLATAMVDGAGSLAADSEFTTDELADRVASPGGMTREGLNVLDESKALKSLLLRTLKATADRGTELSKMAGKQP